MADAFRGDGENIKERDAILRDTAVRRLILPRQLGALSALLQQTPPPSPYQQAAGVPLATKTWKADIGRWCRCRTARAPISTKLWTKTPCAHQVGDREVGAVSAVDASFGCGSPIDLVVWTKLIGFADHPQPGRGARLTLSATGCCPAPPAPPAAPAKSGSASTPPGAGPVRSSPPGRKSARKIAASAWWHPRWDPLGDRRGNQPVNPRGSGRIQPTGAIARRNYE